MDQAVQHCGCGLQSKDHPFQAKATAEFAKLRRLQAELENETGQVQPIPAKLGKKHNLEGNLTLPLFRRSSAVRLFAALTLIHVGHGR